MLALLQMAVTAARGIARSNSRLLDAFEQYPPESWFYEVLERLTPGCSYRDRREAEQRHIDLLRSWDPEAGFNMHPAIWEGEGPAQQAARQWRAELLNSTRARRRDWLAEFDRVVTTPSST
jgi:hypothetical protein